MMWYVIGVLLFFSLTLGIIFYSRRKRNFPVWRALDGRYLSNTGPYGGVEVVSPPKEDITHG